MKFVALIWGLGLLQIPGSSGNKEIKPQTDVCTHTVSCTECISSHPNCAWCSAKNFTHGGEQEASRCATRLELLRRGCDEEHLINPQGSVNVQQDTPLSDNAEQETVTQLAPQRVLVRLRPGERTKFQVRFKRAEGYPIDLYYLMDLSYSMKDDLENVKKLGSDIHAALHGVTKSVRIGFGSFVDKTVLPYVSTVSSKLQNPCPSRTERCQPPFSYRHVLSLTSNLTLFQLRVSAENISGNLDAPEGGLDAMLQAAVCTNHIGWRNVTRLLVFASDDVFHTAGDGKLGGIYLPSDGRCHLNENGEYDRSHIYDYPSVGHLAQVLSAANIQPIFAVTSSFISTYQELSELIPKSVVGELKEDSSNVVNLISEAYNNLSSTVNLEHLHLPRGFHISYDSHCPNSSTYGQPRGQCSGVRINQLVDFQVTLWMDKTMCKHELQSFRLRVLGFSEELRVDVEPLCDCDCGDEEAFSDYCSKGLGNYSCGVCSCSEGHRGKNCECRPDEDDTEAGCWGEGSLPCSGRGRCECGHCLCNIHVRGKLCDCDDASCERHEGHLCGGISRGVCNCGTCECSSNYTGSACSCSGDTSACTANGEVCSGHGRCVCNKCDCDTGYFNRLCSECPGCQTPCKKHRNCTECKAFGTGPLSDKCSLFCEHTNVTVIQASESGVGESGEWCQEKGTDSLLTFRVLKEEGTLVYIVVMDKQDKQSTLSKCYNNCVEPQFQPGLIRNSLFSYTS
ncbi:integrin beta-7 isoform X2 [Ascaphus truei]|uniref:integrin beta-7 isoform X2 n=1 Tax=Ascaphus truei TaxID=8439 RepID=UPI003F5A69CC